MSLSERQFIAALRGRQGISQERIVCGIGDDCAVYRLRPDDEGPCYGIITTDALVERVHFDLSWHPPRLLGRKALSVNISDIAAMGGVPLFALLTVGFPNNFPRTTLDDCMSGFHEVLDEHHLHLIGGDTVKSSVFFMSITVMGEVEKSSLVLRSGACPGDLVWVSGPLGGAAAALELYKRHGSGAQVASELMAAHLDPRARRGLGEMLAAAGVGAMMDISDGIATDLAHICKESGVGAEIDPRAVPISTATLKAAGELSISPLDLALRGGEDYELLFTTTREAGSLLPSQVKDQGLGDIYCIGRIVEGAPEVRVLGESAAISYGGFDHFAET